MRALDDIAAGDRVKFNETAVRRLPEADGRRRFTVTAVQHYVGFAYYDCVLDDGSTFANQWLERID